MMVHNLNGTAKNDLPSGYASWLSYWADHSGQLIGECPVIGCRRAAMHGAHVQKDDDKDRRYYIAPMCAYHNEQKGKHLKLNDDVELVPVNELNLSDTEQQVDCQEALQERQSVMERQDGRGAPRWVRSQVWPL